MLKKLLDRLRAWLLEPCVRENRDPLVGLSRRDLADLPPYHPPRDCRDAS